MKKCTTIGGQALPEGILMKGPSTVAIALRSKDHTIKIKQEPVQGLAMKYALFRKPFFRGIAALIDSMSRGARALNYAIENAEDDEDEQTLTFLEKKLGKEKAERLVMSVMTFISIVMTIGIFFFIPTLISGLFRKYVSNTIILYFIEGLIRISLFLIYVLLISHLREMKRVFMYHGAEHKTIACYEDGKELTVENVKDYPRLHPRCGTSFLANLVIISCILLSFFGWPHPLIRLLIRIAMIPILVGITYELNLWTGRKENFLTEILRAPGLFVQKIATVREPDEDMIEVAIMAMKAVIPENPQEDCWIGTENLQKESDQPVSMH